MIVLFLNESEFEQINWITDSFVNKTRYSLYEWVIEVFTQLICSKVLIHLEMKQVILYEWAIEWVKDTNVSVQLFCLKEFNPNLISWNKLMFATSATSTYWMCISKLSYIWSLIYFFSWQIVYPASFGCRVVLYWFAQYMISVIHMSRTYMIHIWPHMPSNQEVVKFS